MATLDAIRELEAARQDLIKELADLNARSQSISEEIARIDDALGALATDTDNDDATTVTDHTGKYRALWHELVRHDADKWHASFSEIESILGFPLPPSSRRHLPHWYGTGGSAVARAIHDAGWRASNVDLDSETVIFKRR